MATLIFDPILEANMVDKVLLKTTGASEGHNPFWSAEGPIKTKRRFAPTFKDMLKPRLDRIVIVVEHAASKRAVAVHPEIHCIHCHRQRGISEWRRRCM